MKILGIDPSLSSTGYAIIDSDTKELIKKGRYCTFKTDSTDDRIQKIILHLKSFNPIIDKIALEDGYVGPSRQTSLALSELRGAIIAYYRYNCYEVDHQAPKAIRKNFNLPGNAKKEDVAKEVLKYYPNLKNEIGPYNDKTGKNKTSDIYDAIAIALSFASRINNGKSTES